MEYHGWVVFYVFRWMGMATTEGRYGFVRGYSIVVKVFGSIYAVLAVTLIVKHYLSTH